jgi:hypothetical protein
MESSPPVGAPVVGPAVAATPTVNRGRRALKLFLAAFLLTAVGAGFIVYLNVRKGRGKTSTVSRLFSAWWLFFR